MSQTQTTKKLIASCIYCTNPPVGEEHWLNRSLGRFLGAEMLKGRICDPCNRHLGRTIDLELVRTAPTGFMRQVLGIKGRSSHETRNVFDYKASFNEPPVQMFRPDASGERQVLEDVIRRNADGTMVTAEARSLVISTESGERRIRLPKLWGEEQLRTAADKLGLLGGTVVRAYGAPSETLEEFEASAIPMIRNIFKLSPSGVAVGITRLDGEVGPIQQTRVQFDLSSEYHRCLAKIGFHYFLWACPQLGGDEPEFAGLRAFIRNGQGTSDDFLKASPPLLSRRGHSSSDNAAHAIGVSSTEEDLVVAHIHFFFQTNGPEYPTFLVKLGRRPDALPPHWRRAHAAVYMSGVVDHDGILEELVEHSTTE